MFHVYDPPAGTNPGATPQQHAENNMSHSQLPAGCLMVIGHLLYVSATVTLFNCLFSYQVCATHREHLNKAAHKNALAFQQLHKRDICLVYQLRNKG